MNTTLNPLHAPAPPDRPASSASAASSASSVPSRSTTPSIRSVAARAVGELRARQPRLASFGVLLLALILPMAVAWLFDDRMVQGANVWIKPIKFALSIAVFALTTAWFVGHLPPQRRRSRAVERIVWLVIGSGTFELAYITLQAALGEASHYNVGDAFHGAMYTLMGLGATLLTATQPMLAWELYRHPDPARPTAYRQSVLAGLTLTFVMGAGVGWLLGGLEPPRDPSGIPLLGWVLTGGDLRPAHFVGVHAAQVLPLLGFAVAASRLPGARRIVWIGTLLYVGLFAGLVALGLDGRV
jgi:hypothetical protein